MFKLSMINSTELAAKVMLFQGLFMAILLRGC